MRAARSRSSPCRRCSCRETGATNGAQVRSRRAWLDPSSESDRARHGTGGARFSRQDRWRFRGGMREASRRAIACVAAPRWCGPCTLPCSRSSAVSSWRRPLHRGGDDPGCSAQSDGLARAVTLALALGWLRVPSERRSVSTRCGVPPRRLRGCRGVAIAALLSPAARFRPGDALPIPSFRSSSVCRSSRIPHGPVPSDKGSDNNLPRDDLQHSSGFSAGQVPSLDMLVDVISRESPDVLVLQEVVRGWMIDEQHDALACSRNASTCRTCSPEHR